MQNNRSVCLPALFILVLVCPSTRSAPPAPSVRPIRSGPSVFSADTAGPRMPGRSEPILLSKQFVFTEGPAVDAAGNIFFTDQPNNRIWEYDTAGRFSIFLEPAGRSNGMYIDRRGNLIACADEKDQLWSISPAKKITVLLDNIRGRRFNGPNDCWVAPGGGIYFTDPYYQRPYWDRTHTDLDGEKVYYLPPGGKNAVAVASDLAQPNGIVGTPDGKQLYVADIKAGRTWVYRIARDGALQDKRLFVSMGSDGMTLDDRGNLYLTGDGVTVFDRRGKKIDHIHIAAEWTANLCFGGRTRTDLFITASGSVYIVHMPVKGVE